MTQSIFFIIITVYMNKKIALQFYYISSIFTEKNVFQMNPSVDNLRWQNVLICIVQDIFSMSVDLCN